MPTTLDDQQLTEAVDDRFGTAEPDGRTNPFATPPVSPGPSTVLRCEPPVTSSLDRETDIGSYITPAVGGFLVLAAVGSLIVGAAGWADMAPFPVIAASVFVVVAGLLARLRFGGGRGTALVGLLLVPVVALCATAAPHLDDGVGDRSYHPTSFDDVEADYQFGIGNLDIDLRDVEFPPGEHVITIEHGIGAASVHLPADVSYSVSGEVAIGKLDVLGESDDGFNTTIDAGTEGAGDAKVVLDFDTSIGYGSVVSD